jgi:hypothetical protein
VRRGRLILFVVVLAAALALTPAAAHASQLVDRNARDVKLEVNGKGQALLTYLARGRRWRVLAWGATNAIAPTPIRSQVKFRLDYAGGWGTYGRPYWRSFRNQCRGYEGPTLHWLVRACKAPDGSYWALQSWQRMLPNYGLVAAPHQAVWELRLSHWRGPLASLVVKLDWAYRRYDHLYGTYSYLDDPIFGFRVTRDGQPLDTFGRNLYVDTFDSAYGTGWRRENSFLTQNPRGNFCYGFYAHGNRRSGKGERYRATIVGPGVTPDVYWESAAPGPYDRELDVVANEEQEEIAGSGKYCRPN